MRSHRATLLDFALTGWHVWGLHFGADDTTATSAETVLHEQRCIYPTACRDVPDTGIQPPPILSLDRVSAPLDLAPAFHHSPTMGARSTALHGSLPRSSTMPLGRRELHEPSSCRQGWHLD